MSIGAEQIVTLASLWAAAMLRASLQGAAVIGLVWAACRWIHKLPANARCWLWRLAYLKFFVALCWASPVILALLPPAPVTRAVAEGPATPLGSPASPTPA